MSQVKSLLSLLPQPTECTTSFVEFISEHKLYLLPRATYSILVIQSRVGAGTSDYQMLPQPYPTRSYAICVFRQEQWWCMGWGGIKTFDQINSCPAKRGRSRLAECSRDAWLRCLVYKISDAQALDKIELSE